MDVPESYAIFGYVFGLTIPPPWTSSSRAKEKPTHYADGNRADEQPASDSDDDPAEGTAGRLIGALPVVLDGAGVVATGRDIALDFRSKTALIARGGLMPG